MKVNFRGEHGSSTDWVDYVLKLEGLDKDWLNAGWDDIWEPKLKNIEQAYMMLEKHLFSDGLIRILIDSDCDGFCSSALMYNWIMMKNPNKRVEAYTYEGKIHGILDAVEFPHADLVIIPDAGSSQEKEMNTLAVRGMDVLIMDHHLTDKDLTNERIVVVNPHLEGCPYPNKMLSGTGVSWKVCQYYDEKHNSLDYKKLIDLVATANVADVMSCKTKENKAIINIGLSNFNNPFLRAIHAGTYSIADKEMTPMGIAFYVAPLINSVVRIGTLTDKLDLFYAFTSQGQSQNLIASFKKIKSSQDNTKEKAFVRIAMDIQNKESDNHKVILVEVPNKLPKSMTGLIAGQVASAYLRPTLLGRINEDGDFVGSIRSLQNSNVENFKSFCEDSGLMNWTAGHESACGFSIPQTNIKEFLDYCDEKLPEFETQHQVAVDLSQVENKAQAITQIAELNQHAGTDFQPVLLYNEIQVNSSDLSIIGKNKNTLKIQHKGITYIKFFYKNKNFNEGVFGWEYNGEVLNRPVTLKIVGTGNINEWGGNITPQIMIQDFEVIVD